MITFPIGALCDAARRRPAGYLDDVLAHASVEGDMVSLTEEAYAELREKYRNPPPPQGPGTELKKLLKTIGIEAKPGCKCNKRAQTMDEKGCDWCAENIDLISAWLQEEAERRGLPYIPTAGKWMINLAIKRARRGIGK